MHDDPTGPTHQTATGRPRMRRTGSWPLQYHPPHPLFWTTQWTQKQTTAGERGQPGRWGSEKGVSVVLTLRLGVGVWPFGGALGSLTEALGAR
ncbi:hypothetical protein GW17_00009521 [Ensete ventricosum]|nr:hypothetical protein GW17_00009521 [Ensete ventricosum]